MLNILIQPVSGTTQAYTRNAFTGNQSGENRMVSSAAAQEQMSFLQVLSATEQQRRNSQGKPAEAQQLDMAELLKKMEDSNRRMRERVQRTKDV